VLVAVTGAPAERTEAEALAAAAGPRCISLAGKTKLAGMSCYIAVGAEADEPPE